MYTYYIQALSTSTKSTKWSITTRSSFQREANALILSFAHTLVCARGSHVWGDHCMYLCMYVCLCVCTCVYESFVCTYSCVC